MKDRPAFRCVMDTMYKKLFDNLRIEATIVPAKVVFIA